MQRHGWRGTAAKDGAQTARAPATAPPDGAAARATMARPSLSDAAAELQARAMSYGAGRLPAEGKEFGEDDEALRFA